VQVVKLSQSHIELVEEFCRRCGDAGYKNNSSLALMKWGEQYDLPQPAQWWALVDNNKIISISGCHELDGKSLRTLFRSATLPQYQKLLPGISRNHMNSVPFSVLLPHQIQWGLDNGYTEFCITTNGEHDASGKMGRTHRALTLLSLRGVVEFSRQEVLYDLSQTVWRINLERYYQARSAVEPMIKKIIVD